MIETCQSSPISPIPLLQCILGLRKRCQFNKLVTSILAIRVAERHLDTPTLKNQPSTSRHQKFWEEFQNVNYKQVSEHVHLIDIPIEIHGDK